MRIANPATIVFVHGVPETAAIWRKVQAAIGRPSVALALPGFGCALPEGFDTTKDGYAAWLIQEIEAIGTPVDLVGHDWGAGLTYRVASSRSDLLHSWVADVAGMAHPDYVWHDFAQLWQTPGDGEAFFEMQNALPLADRAAGLETMNIGPEDALEVASAGDTIMGACILDLYRSAMPNVHTHWGPWTPTGAQGLIIHPTEDPFSSEQLAPDVAEAFRAHLARLEGAGHFWPYQSPDEAAALLIEFWDSLST